MNIKLFTIPIADNGAAQVEMNKFLGSHRVLEIGQHFYQNDQGAAWCFCVRFLGSGGGEKPNSFPSERPLPISILMKKNTIHE